MTCRCSFARHPIGPEPAGGVTATIEYGVQALRVRHIIVCGHSDCGVIHALMSPHGLDELPSVRGWLQHVQTAWDYVDEVERHGGELTRQTALAHANVLAQLASLRTHGFVQNAVTEGRLQLHGWYYDILSGRIEQYDDEMRRFLPLVK